MSDMKIVTFKKEWRGYAIGETAGFASDEADVLIESGRAKAYAEKPATDSTPKVPASKKGSAKKSTTVAAGSQVNGPANPVDSVNPVDPADAVDPVDPVDPVDQVDQVDPADQDDEKP